MVEALNAACFTQPHWLVIARGYEVERWLTEDQYVGTGGIQKPEAIHLRVGNRYYRFASSVAPRYSQIGGGWWIDYENFHEIDSFASKHGYTLSEAARLFLALPNSWSKVDRLVSAILEVPLKAYAGQGKVAEDKDGSGSAARWIPLQHNRALQLYIPGLYVPGLRRRRQLYELAFPHPKFEHILTNRRPV